MGLLKKLGIIESDEVTNDNERMVIPDFSAQFNVNKMAIEDYTPEVDINTSDVVMPDDIYAAANLTDLSKSIFKVDEIKKVLPASMTEETKKQSVIGMMQVSNITVEEVVNDANARTEALLGTLQKSTNETEEIIASGELEIKSHEAEIEALKARIEERKKIQEDQNKVINAELEKVNSIKGFIL